MRLATLLILVIVLVALLWSGQRHLIYFPSGALPSPGQAGLAQAEIVSFATDDGLILESWFVRPEKPSSHHPTVLFLSGNGGNRAMRAPLAAHLARRGIATLLVDYRGYGGNPGRPSEEGLALDASAARRYLGSRPDIDHARIVYFGESLGTGVAVRLAAEDPPLALILRSPFTSLSDVGRYHYPWLPVRLMLRDRFASLERIPFVKSPPLVIAGSEDRIVPTPLSERLFAASAGSPKQLLIVDDADHNDYELLAGSKVIDTVVTFLEQVQ